MKKTFALVLATFLLLLFAGFTFAEEGSWSGYISDEACAKDYAKASAEKHVACANGCVSKGGKWALAMKDGKGVKDVQEVLCRDAIGLRYRAIGVPQIRPARLVVPDVLDVCLP